MSSARKPLIYLFKLSSSYGYSSSLFRIRRLLPVLVYPFYQHVTFVHNSDFREWTHWTTTSILRLFTLWQTGTACRGCAAFSDGQTLLYSVMSKGTALSWSTWLSVSLRAFVVIDYQGSLWVGSFYWNKWISNEAPKGSGSPTPLRSQNTEP